ncbi:MAG: AAA family ATPase [Bacteroidetes bacterium]|nr:AAA family ATPase [Bacteroidota bacterium]
MAIKKISIENYKSIKKLDGFELGKINILIGSNGVGKSNFISFLVLLKQIVNKNLQSFVAEKSGANNLLHFGRKQSGFLRGRIEFKSDNAYEFILKPNSEDSFFFFQEIAAFYSAYWHNDKYSESGYFESKLDKMVKDNKDFQGYEGIPGYVKKALAEFEIYHFHDTGVNSPIKMTGDVNDNRFLRKDASNLAAFLLVLKERHPKNLKQIESVVRQIAPFFDGFNLAPLLRNPEKIKLEWREKGNDEYFNADQLSDGTLRMIALSTLILQPNPPATIIIDEPELGLHPAAIQLLAGLIQKASVKSQIIISTQSVTLVNQFGPEDLIIVERLKGATSFKRLSTFEMESWLENYSLGDAWEKNVIGGRP